MDFVRPLTKSVVKELVDVALILPLAFIHIKDERSVTVVSDACTDGVDGPGAGVGVIHAVPAVTCVAQLGKAIVVQNQPPVIMAVVPQGDSFFWGYDTNHYTQTDITARELQAFHTAVVRGSRSVRYSFHSTVVAFCDNMGVVGMIQKGRTSAFGLNRQLQRHAAYQLLNGLYIEIYYIPSDANPADSWSRGWNGFVNKRRKLS